MPCGCGGGFGGAAADGPLLSGTLDPQYADSTGAPAAQLAQADIAGGITPRLTLTSLSFWVIVGVVIVAALYADREKRRSE